MLETAAPGPTSLDLIKQALAVKAIDEEAAHKYRVFSMFGDTRLPAQYRGSGEWNAQLLETIGEAGRLRIPLQTLQFDPQDFPGLGWRACLSLLVDHDPGAGALLDQQVRLFRLRLRQCGYKTKR